MSDDYAEVERLIARNNIDMPMLAHAMISLNLLDGIEAAKNANYLEDAAFTATEFHSMWLDRTCYPDSDITLQMLKEQYGHLCVAVAELSTMLGLDTDECVRKYVDSLIAQRKKDGK